MHVRKAIERLGRRALLGLLSRLLRVPARTPRVPPAPRLLVLRTDARVGNAVLLTPILATLKRGFPDARIDVLAHPTSHAVLASHPAVAHVRPYHKAGLWHRFGPLQTLRWLRRQRYDVCLEMSNPTDPSLTQALLARLAGARVSVGAGRGAFARLLHCPVDVTSAGPHEIDLRLAVLSPFVPHGFWVRTPSLGIIPLRVGTTVPAFVRGLGAGAYAVVNVGARLAHKCLTAGDYAQVTSMLRGWAGRVVVTWGPHDVGLAAATARLCRGGGGVWLAPPTDIGELAHIMARARCVVTCDTGPMHLAVALGRPTCGLFVCTSMARFGYAQPPHACLLAEPGQAAIWLPAVGRFVRAMGQSVGQRVGRL